MEAGAVMSEGELLGEAVARDSFCRPNEWRRQFLRKMKHPTKMVSWWGVSYSVVIFARQSLIFVQPSMKTTEQGDNFIYCIFLISLSIPLFLESNRSHHDVVK